MNQDGGLLQESVISSLWDVSLTKASKDKKSIHSNPQPFFTDTQSSALNLQFKNKTQQKELDQALFIILFFGEKKSLKVSELVILAPNWTQTACLFCTSAFVEVMM